VYTTTPYQELEVVTKWLWLPNVWRIGSVSMYLTMHLASEATQIMMMQHSNFFNSSQCYLSRASFSKGFRLHWNWNIMQQ
jgi:hypothetical protein